MHDVRIQDVDIYSVDLDVPDTSAPGILSSAELDRAARFRFERDRNRFVHCRATVRRILADYLDAKPEQIKFAYNAYGKPFVNEIFFNVSHADRIAMIAVSRSQEVGIDVERIDPAFAHEQIPERFFSTCEMATLRSLPEASQLEAFFDIWTRKEAYMKGRGLGFALPSTSFDVANLPGNWALEAIAAPPGYVAALSVKSHRAGSLTVAAQLREAALCVKRPAAPYHYLSITSSTKCRGDSRHSRPGGPRHMARNEFQSCDTL